jgi:hypothetical protein
MGPQKFILINFQAVSTVGDKEVAFMKGDIQNFL